MGKTVKTKIRVWYSDTDRMGVVHHSRYYPWFETARDNFIRSAGISYLEMEEKGLMLPLVESRARYIVPAKYDDEIEISCSIAKLTVVRCLFEYEAVRMADGEVIVRGETLHAFCNSDMHPINCQKKFPEFFDVISKMAL